MAGPLREVGTIRVGRRDMSKEDIIKKFYFPHAFQFKKHMRSEEEVKMFCTACEENRVSFSLQKYNVQPFNLIMKCII